MIKIIAFDLVGVLVTEKDIKLTKEECKLERMFGSNVNDSDYLMEARKIIKKDSIVMRRTEDLINKIYDFKEIVELSAIKRAPHLITNYVYELATLFHVYYTNEKVLKDEDENYTQERMNLIKCVKITIKNALNLIGVTSPEKM